MVWQAIKHHLLWNFQNCLRKIYLRYQKNKVSKDQLWIPNKLNTDLKNITLSRETLTPADKTSKFYKITKEKHEQLLHNSYNQDLQKSKFQNH